MKKQINAHHFGLATAGASTLILLLVGFLPMVGMYSGTMMMGSHMGYWFTPLTMIAWIIQAAIFGYICGYVLIWIYNKLE